MLEAVPWENPTYGILGGAAGNVAYGGTVNPPRNRKGGAGNPPPTGARASALPDREGTSAGAGDLLPRLRAARASEREGVLVEFLREQLQRVLRLPAPPSPDVGFFDLGMDSLMAVELRTRLNRALAGEVVVPNTVVFDYPNPAKLALYLAGELGGVGEEKPKSKHRSAARRGEERIAVVGMACRFPGGRDVSAFWSHLESGGDAVTKGRPGDLVVDADERAHGN